jgi:predicted butyrate kinase (DUF1464 family)
MRSAGALDGEVAYLAGSVSKAMLFTGGASSVAGEPDAAAETLAMPQTARARVAWEAYLESAVKSVAALSVTVPGVSQVVLSGRLVRVAAVRDEIERRLAPLLPAASVHVLSGFTQVAKQLADGLAGGANADLVEALGIREASGTVLDHLYVIPPEAAKVRLGIE